MAEIRVNAEQWDELSPRHREFVITVLVDQGVLTEGDTIAGDATVAPLGYPGEKSALVRDAASACVDGCWYAAEMAYAVCVQHGGGHAACAQAMEMYFKACVAEMCPEALG